MTANTHTPLARLQECAFAMCAAALICFPQLARADADGYDTPLAQAVRNATQRYRLALWARLDGYVQSTDYLSAFGTTYTNHARFDPLGLQQPTVLLYDMAGRLAACGYQFRNKSKIFASLRAADVKAWYDIPGHLHYNVVVNGTVYYEQHLWDASTTPTAELLIRRDLIPPQAVLKYAFVHPATTAILIWAWQPNPNGLFDTENPSLP